MAAQRPSHEREQDGAGVRPARLAPRSPAGRLPAPGRLGSADPTGLLALQRLAGNTAVGQTLQRERAADDGARETGETAVQRSVHSVLRGPGQPLDPTTRTDMESRFGTDFSDVRLHTDGAAKESAAGLGARAYTSGSHVVIGEGGADRHTLAHELTHVVQQRSGPVAGTDRGDGLRVSDPGDRFEREAEQQATRVLGAASPAGGEHAPAEHAGHSHAGHAHAGAPGAAVQRMRSSRAPDPLRATADEQLAQRDQIDDIVALWVPNEEFDAEGQLVRTPEHAYAAQRQGYDTDALRVPRTASLPRATASRRGGTLQQSWEVEYQTSFYVYRVEIINTDVRHSPTLIDTARRFRIVRMTPKGSGGRSMGRTYRFGDYWAPNPAYVGGQDLDSLAQARGLGPDNRVDGNTQGLVPLPTDPSEPFVFYTRNVVDPNFTNADGTAKDERRFLSRRGFDALADEAQAEGRTRGQTRVSRPPTVDRATAGRHTATAMGGFAAHQMMPTTGRGGANGRLASHEWCHLIGDGDNGPTVFQNLVVGTNAVNSEQLAMETALRDFRQRLLGLGYAIRLNVEAIVERTEAESPGMPGGAYNKADWISFAIDVIEDPGRGAGSAEVIRARSVSGPVHRQIMDAQRGTITESEFTSLHNQVRNKLRSVHAELREAQEAARRRSRHGSPMAVDY
ncbi:eCIS core domain-containing protein [Streptomyces sp. NPDC002499]